MECWGWVGALLNTSWELIHVLLKWSHEVNFTTVPGLQESPGLTQRQEPHPSSRGEALASFPWVTWTPEPLTLLPESHPPFCHCPQAPWWWCPLFILNFLNVSAPQGGILVTHLLYTREMRQRVVREISTTQSQGRKPHIASQVCGTLEPLLPAAVILISVCTCVWACAYNGMLHVHLGVCNCRNLPQASAASCHQ